MSVRKLPYTDPKTGEKHMSEKFYAIFQDHQQIKRRLVGFTDRKATMEVERKVRKLVDLRAAGDTTPPELARFIETMTPIMRQRLAEWGIIDPTRVAAGKSLAKHLDDWRNSLLSKDNTQRHAELVTSRARKAFEGCRFKSWTDISPSKLETFISGMRADMRKPDGSAKRGISAQTYNFYLQACKQFCRWMVEDHRATENPLTHLHALNVKTDRRHDRAVLGVDDLRWLLSVTQNGFSIFGQDGKPVWVVEAAERNGMSAAARALLYRVAVETGLRAGELRSLTSQSFQLVGADPSVTIAAAYAKNRREDTLPLRADTALMLRAHLSAKMPSTPAFAMPAPSMLVRMFRADLADARRAWIAAASSAQDRAEREQSSRMRYRDETGLVADFHSLRHSCGYWLLDAGVDMRVVQRILRHSTITLTVDRYGKLRGLLGNQSQRLAITKLPELSQSPEQALAATGTDEDKPKPDGPSGGPGHMPRGLPPSLSLNSGLERSGVGLCGNRPVSDRERASLTNVAKHAGFPGELTVPAGADSLKHVVWRDGRVAEGDGLLNRCVG